MKFFKILVSILGFIFTMVAFAALVILVLAYLDCFFTRSYFKMNISDEGKRIGYTIMGKSFSFVFLCILFLVGNIGATLLLVFTKKRLLAIRYKNEKEQEYLDRCYRIRKISGRYFFFLAIVAYVVPLLIVLAVYIISTVLPFSFLKPLKLPFFIYCGLPLAVISFLGCIFSCATCNDEYCEKCHRSIAHIDWSLDDTSTSSETRTKNYSGWSEKVGTVSYEGGNSANVYKEHSGGSYNQQREVTTYKESRACPFCGKWHYKRSKSYSSWK